MPVIHARIPPLKPGVDAAAVMKAVRAAAGGAMGLPESKIWATWDVVDQTQDCDLVATVVLFEGRTLEMKTKLLEAIAGALGEGLGVDRGQMFISLHEVGPGEVFVGGRVKLK
jgi:phenylpyruvate tautomerase PptA (4-oxalocrotonate tautomerase family)